MAPSLVRAMADGATADGETYEVEELLAERIRDKGGRVLTEYLVKWVGYSTEDNTWEPHRNILDVELMHKFEARRCAPPGFSAKQRGLGGLLDLVGLRRRWAWRRRRGRRNRGRWRRAC